MAANGAVARARRERAVAALRRRIRRAVVFAVLGVVVLVAGPATARRAVVSITLELYILSACFGILALREAIHAVTDWRAEKRYEQLRRESVRSRERSPVAEFTAHSAAAAARIDWVGFVQSVAARLEEALGEGFFAHGHGYVLLLSRGDVTRRLDLRELFFSLNPDFTMVAMQACIRMLDQAQMFKMQQLERPWPVRVRDDTTPEVTLPRPHVTLAEFELHMTYDDELGTVLSLPALPWVEGHPEPDGPLRLA